VVRWKEFEILAEHILSDLAPLAVVKLDDHIPGRLSGIARQIDVSVRWNEADDDLLLVVQAKDWAKPADVTAIDEFASVIEDVMADRGILICRAGFTPAAQTYARNRDIFRWNLHDAASANWNLQLRVPLLWIDLFPKVSFDFLARLEAGDELLPHRTLPFALTQDGALTALNPLTTFESAWNNGTIPRTPGLHHGLTSANEGEVGAIVRTRKGEQAIRPVERFGITYTVETVGAWLGHFTPSQCRGYVNYLKDKAFVASHLPVGEIPFERDNDWVMIDDPALVATRLRGTFVTTENCQFVVPGTGAITDLTFRRVGD
jgi:hypothetical protein